MSAEHASTGPIGNPQPVQNPQLRSDTAAKQRRKVVAKAIGVVLREAAYRSERDGFFKGYLYRKQFHWLPESGSLPGEENGMACAFREGLTAYAFRPLCTGTAAAPTHSSHTAPADTQPEPEPAERLREYLGAAVKEAVEDATVVSYFIAMVGMAGVPVDVTNVEQARDLLAPHVAWAFANYALKASTNLSPGPW